MAWTTPRTWVTGELVTVGVFNQQIRDNFVILRSARFADADSRLRGVNSTYVEDLSGTTLQNVALLGAANTYSAGSWDFGFGSGARLVIPYGTNKWAT